MGPSGSDVPLPGTDVRTGVARPLGQQGQDMWKENPFGVSAAQTQPPAITTGAMALGGNTPHPQTDAFAELDAWARQRVQAVPFAMLATARPAVGPSGPPPAPPVVPTISSILPDLAALGLGGPSTAGGGTAPPQARPSAPAPVLGANEALLMQVASGLSAIANAVSGGAGRAIQVGQIGAATDPKFPEWDGKEYSLQMWIANATAMKDVHHTSDKHAITYARIKLQKWIQNIYPENEAEQPKTWGEFTNWLLSHVGPADWQLMSYVNLMNGQVSMKENGLQQYISEFMQLKRICNISDEGLLKAFFLKGLSTNPYLTMMVMNDMDPGWTLQQLIDRARRVHTGVAHPFTMVGLSGIAPHGAIGAQVPVYRGPTAPTPTSTSHPTPMDLDVLESRIATMVAKAMDNKMATLLGGRANSSMDSSPYGANPLMRLTALEHPLFGNTPALNAPVSPLALTAPPQARTDVRREAERRDRGDHSRGRSDSRGRSASQDRNRRPQSRERSESGLHRSGGYGSGQRYENKRAESRRSEPGPSERRPGDRSRSHSRERGPMLCWNCQEEGHKEADCPNPRRPPTPGRRESDTPPRRVRCYCCGEPGHIATRCPMRMSRRDGKKRDESSGGKESGK